MEKTIRIGNADVKFKATALTPRLYRAKVGRDMISDLMQLQDALKNRQDGVSFSALDLEIFENVAYIMAKQADATVPTTAEEWLDTFEVFSIYHILPQLLELWGENVKTTSEPKNA